MLLQLPPTFHDLSLDQFYDEFGPPEPEPVIRYDGKELPPGVPKRVYAMAWLGKRAPDFTLDEAQLLLSDLGVAFRPAENPRFESYTPFMTGPPEARFDPTTPLTFASDIWSLALGIWTIMGWNTLLSSFLFGINDTTRDLIDTLGPLPPEWWEKCEPLPQWFTKDGRPKEGREVYTLDRQFMRCIQDPRRKGGMEVFGEEERTAFCDMIRGMLAYRPGERLSAKHVLESAWVRDWAMPNYKEAMDSWMCDRAVPVNEEGMSNRSTTPT